MPSLLQYTAMQRFTGADRKGKLYRKGFMDIKKSMISNGSV